jgi:hypothetical protein
MSGPKKLPTTTQEPPESRTRPALELARPVGHGPSDL